jgi:hypothetical protein
VVIGVIGVLLPIVLVGGNRVVFGQSNLLPSLSGYYHSGMRNWFVGSLWAIGSGLLVYLAARRNLADSVISFVAGLLAVGVALFPTNPPTPSRRSSPSFTWHSPPCYSPCSA